MVKTANGKQIRVWTFDIPLRSLVKLIYLTSALKNKNQKLRKHSLHARTGLYLQIYPYLFFIDKTFYGYVARLTDLVIKRYLTFSHAQPAIDVLLIKKYPLILGVHTGWQGRSLLSLTVKLQWNNTCLLLENVTEKFVHHGVIVYRQRMVSGFGS